MLEDHLERIFDTLDSHSVRYLVVGGLAVVAHGHARFTADLDLVVALDPTNAMATVTALKELGYVPRAPVPAEQFADSGHRRAWALEKGMVIFQLFSEMQPETAIDLFVQPPFDFESEYRRAPRIGLIEGKRTPVVSLPTLLKMKRTAGRRQDLGDIEALRVINPDQSPESGV